jgi:hypothetical protein
MYYRDRESSPAVNAKWQEIQVGVAKERLMKVAEKRKLKKLIKNK